MENKAASPALCPPLELRVSLHARRRDNPSYPHLEASRIKSHFRGYPGRLTCPEEGCKHYACYGICLQHASNGFGVKLLLKVTRKCRTHDDHFEGQEVVLEAQISKLVHLAHAQQLVDSLRARSAAGHNVPEDAEQKALQIAVRGGSERRSPSLTFSPF